jgi:hypothetical protein
MEANEKRGEEGDERREQNAKDGDKTALPY